VYFAGRGDGREVQTTIAKWGELGYWETAAGARAAALRVCLLSLSRELLSAQALENDQVIADTRPGRNLFGFQSAAALINERELPYPRLQNSGRRDYSRPDRCPS
jgi:hypothetical protein